MSNVRPFPNSNSLGDGGGGGDEMEERLRSVEQSLAVMESNYCKKEDLHKEISRQTWTVVGFGALLTGALLTAMAAGFGWL